MRRKATSIILLLLLLALFIANDALCTPKSNRGVKATSETPPSLTELYRNSRAVIIGINRYDKWPSLEYAVNDAKAIEARLRSLGFETQTLIDHNATRSNILRLLGDELPRKVEKNDRVIIFFAGHGQTEELQDGSQMGYIVPVDADTRDIFSTAISMDQVRVFSKRIKAKHVLFLIDSCYSGLGLSRSGTIPPSERDYLRKITARKAHQMLTAGGKGEQAKEEGAHGIFTKYVLEALDGQADRDEKGYITFSDLASYVKPKVSRETRNSQTPQYGNIDGEGEFVFVTGKGGITDAVESQDDEAVASESRKIELERQRLEAERNLLRHKTALEEEKRKLEEEKKQLAMSKRPSPPTVREIGRDGQFIAYDNGTVLDTRSNLMWAARDTGININWQNAKRYCENYRGGGYTDWRMPTQDELAGLYGAAKPYNTDCGYDAHLTELIRLTCTALWASETRGSDGAVLGFRNGRRYWSPQSRDTGTRALPVRSGK
jgi:hypothetical protein